MDAIRLQIKDNTFPSPQTLQSDSNSSGGFNLNNTVSPSTLLIIIILTIIFFLSGLLHLLVRFLLQPPNRDPDDLDNVTALQGQLQQLFHLHDAGVDQSFMDTLPVFNYKAIIGLKDPFDCAVCLCEFEPQDKLRLLPKCGHAFHMECIDTWLLSHSTCPLCRASLLPDFSPNNSCSPIVLVLESGSTNDSSREIVNDNNVGRTSSVLSTNSRLGCRGEGELGSSRINMSQKWGEIFTKDESIPANSGENEKVNIVTVKLGKFRNVAVGEGTSNNKSVDSRRCYSMGSFEYVLDETTSLQVSIRTPIKKQSSKKPSLPLTPGHRPAMSECDCESRREFPGFGGLESVATNGSYGASSIVGSNGNEIGRSERESFSISKIWLRGKKDKNKSTDQDSSRRAFSFRFPASKNVVSDEDSKAKNVADVGRRRTQSEIGVGRWVNGGGSEMGGDEESQSSNISLDSQAKTPSFARRTLLWLVGRQNKVVHSSFAMSNNCNNDNV